MVRSEFLIAGCILVFIGLIVAVIGYNRSQPSELDRALSVVEQLTGTQAPTELKSSRTDGTVILLAGVGLAIGGLILILRSRTTAPNYPRSPAPPGRVEE